MYASGLIWKCTYHNEGARASILCTAFILSTTRRQGCAEVVHFSWKCICYNVWSILMKKYNSWDCNESNVMCNAKSKLKLFNLHIICIKYGMAGFAQYSRIISMMATTAFMWIRMYRKLKGSKKVYTIGHLHDHVHTLLFKNKSI